MNMPVKDQIKDLIVQLEKQSNWTMLKFGIPFLIITVIFICKGLVSNYVDCFEHQNDQEYFYETLLTEFSIYANHSVVIVIIALFEIISEFISKQKKIVNESNFIINLSLIVALSFLLLYSEVQMEFDKNHQRSIVLIFHYMFQLLFSTSVFVKIIYTDIVLLKEL